LQQFYRELAIYVWPKAEIDIVPEDGCIASGRHGGAGYGAGMGVTLDNFPSGIEGESVEGIGQLTKAAADTGDNAAGS
jgi:hypothetical protein